MSLQDQTTLGSLKTSTTELQIYYAFDIPEYESTTKRIQVHLLMMTIYDTR